MTAARRILVVNPNTTRSMTRKIGAAAAAAAYAGTYVEAVNPSDGPTSIEGYFDEALSVPGMLETIRDAGEGFDAFIIACFDDTGLDAARCIASSPVIGIGEAAFHVAALISNRFGVVTTLARSVPAIEHNLARYGLAARCGGVEAVDVPVLDLEDPESGAYARIHEKILAIKAQGRCDAIVLGCAGMADLANRLSHQTDMPVIDGVSCAVKLAESLVGLNLSTARSGAYARPRAKAFTGRYSGWSSGVTANEA